VSANLLQHYVLSFSTNLALLLQQQGSKLRSYITSGTYRGESASPVDQVAPVEMQPIVSIFGPMPRVDAAVDRRWVDPNAFGLPQLIDRFDKLKILTEPESVYTRNAMFAAGRKMDDVIIAAFTSTAKTGKQGGTNTPILPGNTVSVGVGGAASGMNVDKLKRARRILLGHEVDPESDPITVGITAQQEENLLNEIQVISTDFFKVGDRPVLESGRLKSFLGMNFVQIERLATGTDDAAGTSRSCPVWAKSGMHLGIWNDIQVEIGQRNDLENVPWQVYCRMMVGATRLEEKKVVRIWCREV
jgi:hypothetical protein